MLNSKQAIGNSCLNFSPLSANLKRGFQLFLLLTLLFFSSSSVNHETITCKEIMEKMSKATGQIKTLKFKFKKKERIDGKLLSGEQEVKFNHTPQKVYTKIIQPLAGTEVLFAEGVNKNKAYVHPNGFPYVTISLDPYGEHMRNNNHHTVYEVGFDYIHDIISYFTGKAGSDYDKMFIYKGDTTFNNRRCYKVLIDYFQFKYIDYTVKEGETVTDIAYKNYISDYMILQINPEIEDYNDVKAGQKIKIPNAYAKKTLLFIDQEKNLPIVQMMFVDKGLYAQYEFWDLQVNPSISNEEFTKEYKDYNF